MSTNRTRESFPLYRPAGLDLRKPDEGVQYCVKPQIQEPSTPEHIKRWRQSYKHSTGQTITHPGKVYDPLPDQQFPYGIKTKGSIHVDDVLVNKGDQGVKKFMKDLREDKYASHTREPLGRGYNRGHEFPPIVNNKDFRFGVSTKASESTKEVLYNPVGLFEPEETRKQYIKSHGMYDAGEQKKRDYNWKFNPDNHMFGKSEKIASDEMKLCLMPENKGGDEFPKTKIVSKHVEDFRDVAEEAVGKTRNLGQTNPYVNTEHRFGLQLRKKDDWDAAKCIRGEGTKLHVEPDQDLGRSTKHGFRNLTKPGDDNRVFGVPTIRDDIKKPKLKSVADTTAYGDDPAANEILFPQRFADMGLTLEDFMKPRPKDQIKRIFAAIGYEYKAGKFEGIYQRAQDIMHTTGDVSVQAFMKAVQEMDDL
eukprot:CAMPEP_0176430524 /NCGR_PEP_ID=MMETSP0127-20121128/14302_1 /TAXON_ID=938130 /ORGANISM="Platyophrya macrostoma, Strain WH" /LENGTH=419 /DNA_ID=CAMNT_0017812425 /DNA_START=6 /DNA_END=1265 /DNA_ORIENTATION=+